MLERDPVPIDRVRGEVMVPWGVAELQRLGLFDTLVAAGGIFPTRNIPYDENLPARRRIPSPSTFQCPPRGAESFVPDPPGDVRGPGGRSRSGSGATILRGVEGIDVSAGSPPAISFRRDGVATEWRPRLVIGADGRNSQVRRQLALKVLADPPHNLLGGMLVDGVPDWPQDLQVQGAESGCTSWSSPRAATAFASISATTLPTRRPMPAPVGRTT